MQDYVIKSGDTFFHLAQKLGCSCQELMTLNPALNPNLLQIGQKIVLPEVKGTQGQFLAEVGPEKGQEFLGQNFDDVQVEIEGIKFRVKRVGEHRVPHEVHLILPRTEIHKIEQGPHGNSELQLMLSNINIVNSPRLMGERTAKAETPEGTVAASKPYNRQENGVLPRDDSIENQEDNSFLQDARRWFNSRKFFQKARNIN